MPEFILPATEDEYQQAGSKFITYPLDAPVGHIEYRDIEIGMLDWDTPGVSMKLPITITENGPDKGKQDKLSFGVSATGIWKGKDVYRAITGTDMPMKAGGDQKMHPAPKSEDLLGKPGVGAWQIQEGHKGGVTDAEKVKYPKLVNISAAGSKPTVQDLGI